MMKTILFTFSLALILIFSCSQKSDKVSVHSPGKSAGQPIKDTGTTDMHNSRNSLDWAGVYQGVLPCADCEGIKTTIILTKDNTFRRRSIYLGQDEKVFADKGSFSWDENGSSIILNTDEGATQMYKVGENVLFHLDQEGQIITGDLAEMYKLRKNTSDPRIEGKKWILTEMMGKEMDQDTTGNQAFIQFNGETGMFSGNGSCNRIFGSYELMEGQRISFGSTGSTMMACPDMETEKKFLDVLEMVDNYSVTDSVLTLNKARMAPLVRFKRVIEE